MKLLVIFLFPFFVFSQSNNYIDYIKDLQKRIKTNDSEKHFRDVILSKVFVQNKVYYNHKNFNSSLNFIDGVRFGSVDSALYLIKTEKEENYLLGWYHYKGSIKCQDLVIYKKGKYYYGGHLDLDFLNPELIPYNDKEDKISVDYFEKFKRLKIRKYTVVTRYYEKTRTFEHAIIYYDYNQEYYGIIRLFKPKIKNGKQTFQYNIEVLPTNFDFKFLFKESLIMKPIELEISNDFTVFVNLEKFLNVVQSIKELQP
jgi:hypothetical protein